MRKRIKEMVISLMVITVILWFHMSINGLFFSAENMLYKSAEGMHLGKIEKVLLEHEYSDGTGIIAGKFDDGVYIMDYKPYFKIFKFPAGGDIIPAADSIFVTADDVILDVGRYSMNQEEGGFIAGYSRHPGVKKVFFHYHDWKNSASKWSDTQIFLDGCMEVDEDGFFSCWYEPEVFDYGEKKASAAPDCVIGVDKEGNIIWHKEEYDVYKHFEKELAELNK